MDMLKIQGVCLLLFLVLIAVDIASAGSKHGFAPIDEQDLSYHLEKQEQVNDPSLYLFSTLSLISRRKDVAISTISKSSSKYALPLATMEIYPELDTHIQSEFLGFTIWGQLGNYFNKNIEAITLENEILGILEKLKDLNERYKDLIPTTSSVVPQPQRLPTLDKKNYVFANGEPARGTSSTGSEDPRYSVSDRSMSDLHSEIQSDKTSLPQEMLRVDPASQRPAPDVSGQRSQEAASPGAAKPPRNSDGSSTAVEMVFIYIAMVFIYIYNSFIALVIYLINNKVESYIFLCFLLLFGGFIKVLLKR